MLLGLLDPHGNLDSQVVPDRPHEQHMMDMPSILQAHLSHRDNQELLQELEARAAGSGSAAARLLRLLAAPLFDPSRYTQIHHIGKGAYANVRATATATHLTDEGKADHCLILQCLIHMP